MSNTNKRQRASDPAFSAGDDLCIRRSRKGNMIASGLPNRSQRSFVSPSGNLRKYRRGRRGRRIFVITGVSLISLLLIAVTGGSIFVSFLFSGFRPDSGDDVTPYPTEALTHQPPSRDDVINILLIGTDSRDPDNDRGRSDSLIILTIDKRHKVIKMASIMRDSYAYIPGGTRSPDKINAAYAYGGPDLAVRTVNSTFRLNIQYYITVNMENMAGIVDLAGGIYINVTSGEMRDMNERLKGSDKLKSSGEQQLNGIQAVQYARVRKVGSDTERTRRQRDVLTLLYKKFVKANVVSKTQMMQKGLALINTNMTAKQLTSFGLDLLPTMAGEIRQMRLPPEGYYRVSTSNGWYMVVDYNRLIPVLYDFIYEEQYPFDPVPTIQYVQGKPYVPDDEPTPEPTEEPTEEPSEEPSETVTPDPFLSPTITPDPLLTGEHVTGEPDITVSPDVSITPDPLVTTDPSFTPEPTDVPTVLPSAIPTVTVP